MVRVPVKQKKVLVSPRLNKGNADLTPVKQKKILV